MEEDDIDVRFTLVERLLLLGLIKELFEAYHFIQKLIFVEL